MFIGVLHLTILFFLFPNYCHFLFLCMFWDICNEIYFHFQREIFMIPLILRLTLKTPVIFMIRGIICIISHIPCVGWNWSYHMAFSLDFCLASYHHTWLSKNIWSQEFYRGKKSPLQPLVLVFKLSCLW